MLGGWAIRSMLTLGVEAVTAVATSSSPVAQRPDIVAIECSPDEIRVTGIRVVELNTLSRFTVNFLI
jgi:hypothetical protein